MKDNKKKKDRRKYPQGSAASMQDRTAGTMAVMRAIRVPEVRTAEKPQDAAHGSRKLEKL